MTGAVPCHEPEPNEARSQPTPHRSNQSDNAAPCGYAALGWSASTWRLQIGLNNLPETTSTPATQPLSKRPLSDAGHLAHAALARASAFVTRDGTIIDARAALIKRFGIDVLTVEELLAILPPDRDRGATMPRSGHGFVCTDASCGIVQRYMKGQSLRSGTISEFASEGGHLVDCIRRVIQRDDDVLACAVLLAPRVTKPVCRMIVHARSEALDGELYTDHLLDVLLREANATAATTVELEGTSKNSPSSGVVDLESG